MLQSIREHVQGWIAGVIIGLLAVGFVLWGLQAYLERGSGGDAIVATVGGQKVSVREFRSAYLRIENQLRQRQDGVALSKDSRQQAKQMALRSLVTTTALLTAASKAGFQVSLEQVKRLIARSPEFQVAGRFSPARFQQLLYANSLTPGQFFSHMHGSLITQQLAGGLQGSAFILPSELQQAYELMKQTRSFGYFILSNKHFAAKAKVSAKQVADFYKQNLLRFKTPEKVSVSYIALKPTQVKGQVTVTESQVRASYEGNLANYKVPQRWQLSRIFIKTPTGANQQQIKAILKRAQGLEVKLERGAKFETLMKQKHPGQQGATQWMSQDQVSGVFAQQLAALKPQQVSKPFATEGGVNIIKLLKVEAARTRPYVKVRKRIKQMLVQQQVDQILSRKNDSLNRLTFTNPTTLKPAAKELKLAVVTSPMITHQGASSGLLKNKKVLAAVFSDEVLKQGNNSAPISLKDGSLVVVRIAKREPSRQLPLKEVSTKIKQHLIQQQAERAAGLQAYTIQTALAAGQSTAKLAKKYQLHWLVKADQGSASKSVPAAVMSAVFQLVPGKKTEVTSVLLPNNDYAVIKLAGIHFADFSKASSKDRQNLRRLLTHYWGQLAYRFYTQAVIASTKVKIDQKVVANN